MTRYLVQEGVYPGREPQEIPAGPTLPRAVLQVQPIVRTVFRINFPAHNV